VLLVSEMQRNGNELLVSEMQKKIGVTDFVSEIKHVQNYPDFEILPHVIQHGLQGFIVKLKSLSTDVFEPRTSTGSRNFSFSTRITPFSLKI